MWNAQILLKRIYRASHTDEHTDETKEVKDALEQLMEPTPDKRQMEHFIENAQTHTLDQIVGDVINNPSREVKKRKGPLLPSKDSTVGSSDAESSAAGSSAAGSSIYQPPNIVSTVESLYKFTMSEITSKIKDSEDEELKKYMIEYFKKLHKDINGRKDISHGIIEKLRHKRVRKLFGDVYSSARKIVEDTVDGSEDETILLEEFKTLLERITKES